VKTWSQLPEKPLSQNKGTTMSARDVLKCQNVILGKKASKKYSK